MKFNQSVLINASRLWVPLAILVTGFCCLSYIVSQQVLRQSANDPQIQVAEDVAAALRQGVQPSAIIPANGQSDVANSLGVFITLYDAQKKPMASSGLLNGQPLTPPSGVFDEASKRGENRITWQPGPQLRFATVVVPMGTTQGGYVLVARSLREMEARIDTLGLLVVSAWAVLMVAMTLGILAVSSGRGPSND